MLLLPLSSLCAAYMLFSNWAALPKLCAQVCQYSHTKVCRPHCVQEVQSLTGGPPATKTNPIPYAYKSMCHHTVITWCPLQPSSGQLVFARLLLYS